MDKLELLLADGIIEAVFGRLKSGKEADLWLVQHGGQVVAAKIYRDRDIRSFKNNAAYKEGRLVGNSRTQRALERGSKFGREAAEQAWKSAEADSLHKLHAHGVRTPTPVLFYEGVLLMELVLGADGQPAPRLIDTALTAEAAGALYRDLRSQVVKMLDADVIHGDLSPYNVLMGTAGPTIIDFPQVIAAAHNNRAETFFLRDLENLRRFLEGFDRTLHSCGGDGREIWRAYVRRELSPDFVPTGHAPPPHHRNERGQQRQAHQQRQQRQPQQQRQAQPQQQRQAQPQQQRQAQPQQQRQGQPQQQRQAQPQQQRPPQQQQQQRPPQHGQPPHGHRRQGDPRASGRAQGGPTNPPVQGPPPQGRRPPPRPQGPVVERVSRLAGPPGGAPGTARPPPGSPQSQQQPGPGGGHRHRRHGGGGWRR